MLAQANAQSLTEDEVVRTMNNALALDSAGKKAEALEAFLAVGSNTARQRDEPERQAYVLSQTMACLCLYNLKRYEEAYLLAHKLAQGRLTDGEKRDLALPYSMSGYMYALDLQKRTCTVNDHYRLSREILQEVEPYANDVLTGYLQPKIPLSWYLEGADHFIAERFAEAQNCYQHALQGFRRLGRAKDEMAVLMEMAFISSQTFHLETSRQQYLQALSLAKSAGTEADRMAVLKGLWTLGTETGDIALARSCAAAMDSLTESSANAASKFTYYTMKGDESRGKRQYAEAEQWYVRAKNLAEAESASPAKVSRYTAYTKLQNLYAATGRYDEALLFSRKALADYRQTAGAADPYYYSPYLAIADIYRLKGDRAGCFASIDSLFRGLDRLSEPRAISDIYTARARCHAAFSEHAEALACYKKAYEVLAAKYPPADGGRVALLPLLGGEEHRLGNHASAERHYRQYAGHAGRLYGENSIEHIDALLYLANAEGFAGHVSSGCDHYVLAAAKLKSLLKERAPYMSAEERESLWHTVSSLFTRMTPYALKAGLLHDPFTRSCYDALVMSKAFLLEAERSLADVVRKEGTEADMRDYMLLTRLKNRIKTMEKDYQLNADSILSLSQSADRIAARLAGRCGGYAEITGFMDVDHKAVRNAMKTGDVLIDFTDFVPEDKGRRYAAYIIKKEDDNPLLKYLFAESLIDSLGISRPDMYYDADYAPQMLKLLWEPLSEHVAEGATVYYVPSQLLFQVSLESLPLADGSLLGSHYNFVRLSSAREVLRAQRPALKEAPRTAVLYGGLQYDMQPETMAGEAKKYNLSALMLTRGGTARGDSLFRELPGTAEEIARIGKILEGCGWKVTLRTGMEGTEESFMSMHGKSPQVLQIATHGFYYTPGRASGVDYLRGYSDAMSLSGIVLSGGNAAWTGKPLPGGVLGGILTARSIAGIDLSGTEMVVLSACQSAQGMATSEGLYGLQRAFKKAGAGTMVMALWSVSDKAAADFMTVFYERLASADCRWNKRKAFEQAKAALRRNNPDPFYWAAFIMLD